MALSLNDDDDSKVGKVIGIDLGTSYSCVGVYKNSKVEIITNEQGNKIMPSYVAFTETGILVGDAAKQQAAANPKNTIFDAKRLIGRKYSDKEIADKKAWPFEIVNKDNRPYVKVVYKGETRLFAPEEISAVVLQKLKSIAERYLGHEVTRAVVTVPAFFSNSQRQATKDACTIAGLVVEGFINAPTAAAIAYGFGKKRSGSNIVVYDLGAGKLDVSIIKLEEDLYEVLATYGDTYLGGQDFDQEVISYLKRAFFVKTNNDITNNFSALAKLRSEVEKAKILLSSNEQVQIDIENLVEGIDFSETLTRGRFDILNQHLIDKTIKWLKVALDYASLKKNEIDDIILVGGSTRIPGIQSAVREFFNNTAPNLSVNPDEAAAYGAAVQGGMLSEDEKMNDVFLLFDINPLTLGIETDGGAMTELISKNSVLPMKKGQFFSTFEDNQATISLRVFEGEREKAIDNILLGTFELSNISPAPFGFPQIEVTFLIDVNGILNVSAEDKSTSSGHKITITGDTNRPSDEEIKQMVENAKKWGKLD